VHSAAAKAVKVDAGTKRSVHAVCSAGTRDQLPNLLQAYLQGGLNLAVFDVARSGRPKQYDTDAEARVTALARSGQRRVASAGRSSNSKKLPAKKQAWAM